MSEWCDSVAVVTGGASGIGKALCEELAARGAIVVVADKDGAGAEQAAAAVRHAGARATAQQADVADEASVSMLIRNTVVAHRRLDYVFNVAGVGFAGDARDIEPEHWRRIINVNLWGVIHGTMSAYAVMAKQGRGHIVNMASLAGLLPNPGSVPYATTKHAVVGLSLSLRAEAAALGVKVSVVCPGFVQSRVLQSATMLNLSRERMIASIPFPFMDARSAARRILAGVARNRAVIAFPGYARLFWWLYRLHPGLIAPILGRMIADLRRLRSTG
jgi:NAD(P)-dependent dehydrogenase (short-subunit alcohol dehydrogenase family)